MTTTARQILRVLAEAGVPTAFGLPGVHNLAFWRELGPGLPGIVSVRHEQTTAYAADGLARATGGLGVALTTTGPGAANAVAGFGEAAASGSPVLLVASEIATSVRRRPGQVRGVLHECRDQAGMFEPLAKAVLRPRTPSGTVEAVAEGARLAMSWPRGPVYVDVPTDVLDADAPEVPYRPPLPAEPAEADLERLVGLVDRCERVVLWAGGGVIQAGAGAALAELAERLPAPVVTTYGGRGALPPRHPCLVGLPPHEPEVGEYVGRADLLVGLGTRFDGMMTRNWSMARPPLLANVNVDAADLDGNYRPDLAVRADVRLVLEALAARVRPREVPVAAELAALREAVWARVEREEPDAVRFLRSVGDAVGDDVHVAVDMAVAGYWWGGYGTVRGPRALAYPVGWGTLGFALPAALGAATRGPALAVCGDGGVVFALGELATAAQERLPLTVLVVDDGGYGMLRFDQDRVGDPHRGVDLLGPDWAALGGAFGITTTVAGSVGEPLRAAVHEATRSGEPRLVVLRAALRPPRTTSPRWRER